MYSKKYGYILQLIFLFLLSSQSTIGLHIQFLVGNNLDWFVTKENLIKLKKDEIVKYNLTSTSKIYL